MKHMLSASLMAGLMFLPTTVRAQSHIELPPPEAAAPTIQVFGEPIARPSMLAPLYVSLASLQAYDGYTTLRGVNNGAQEANALVSGFASKPAAFWAIKVGSTAVSIYMAEQLWRRHRRAEAIATMVIANGVMGVIAARNTAVLRRQR